jgi:hypothetical protein
MVGLRSPEVPTRTSIINYRPLALVQSPAARHGVAGLLAHYLGGPPVSFGHLSMIFVEHQLINEHTRCQVYIPGAYRTYFGNRCIPISLGRSIIKLLIRIISKSKRNGSRHHHNPNNPPSSRFTSSVSDRTDFPFQILPQILPLTRIHHVGIRNQQICLSAINTICNII